MVVRHGVIHDFIISACALPLTVAARYLRCVLAPVFVEHEQVGGVQVYGWPQLQDYEC